MKELAILIGLPAAGKTTFARSYFDGWRILEADVLSPIVFRDGVGLQDCRKFWKAIEDCQDDRIVLDGTFILRRARLRAIGMFLDRKIMGYIFTGFVQDFLARNELRKKRLPDEEILRKARIYEEPSKREGFDEFWHVTADDGRFILEQRETKKPDPRPR